MNGSRDPDPPTKDVRNQELPWYLNTQRFAPIVSALGEAFANMLTSLTYNKSSAVKPAVEAIGSVFGQTPEDLEQRAEAGKSDLYSSLIGIGTGSLGNLPSALAELGSYSAMEGRTPTPFEVGLALAPGALLPAIHARRVKAGKTPWFSRVTRSVAELPRGTGTGAEWLTEIKAKGAPKHELEGTALASEQGLANWLVKHQDERISKETVLAKAQELELYGRELAEVWLTEYNPYKEAFDAAQREADEVRGRWDAAFTRRVEIGDRLHASGYYRGANTPDVLALNEAYRNAAEETDVLYAEYERLNERVREMRRAPDHYNKYYTENLKFRQYTLPGGSNYQTFLLQVDPNATSAFRPGSPKFVQPIHYPQPNILVHLRTVDYTMPNGEKVLLIEEIQSDWNQRAGKIKPGTSGSTRQRYGYRVPPDPDELQRLQSLQDNLEKQLLALEPKVYRTGEFGGTDYITYGEAEELSIARPEVAARIWDARRQQYNRLQDEIYNVRDQLRALNGDPSAPEWQPIQETEEWAGFAFHRAMQEAITGGYDRIAWTTGLQQAARNHKLGRASRINLNKLDDGWIRLGSDLQDRVFKPKEYETVEKAIADITGKYPELAPYFADKEGITRELNDFNWMTIDLHDPVMLGADGHKQLYDATLPKLVKKWSNRYKRGGATIEDIFLDLAPPDQRGAFQPLPSVFGYGASDDAMVHSIRITPSMRNQVMTEGMEVLGTLVPIGGAGAYLLGQDATNAKEESK